MAPPIPEYCPSCGSGAYAKRVCSTCGRHPLRVGRARKDRPCKHRVRKVVRRWWFRGLYKRRERCERCEKEFVIDDEPEDRAEAARASRRI
jgi:hypothetical protein